MKRNALVHGGWALTSILLFVLGFYLAGGSSSLSDSHTNKPSKSGTQQTPLSDFNSSQGRGSNPRLSGENGSDSLSADDPDLLTQRLLNSANGTEQRIAFAELLKGLTAENAVEIREQITHLGLDSYFGRDFHFVWGSKAGAPAILASAETPDSAEASGAVAFSLAGWASQDPDAAIAWFSNSSSDPNSSAEGFLAQHPDTELDLKESLLDGILEGLTNRDPISAAEFLLTYTDTSSEDTGRRMMMATDKIIEAMGSEAAADWSESLQEGKARAEVYTEIARQYVEKEPAAAVRWLDGLPETPDKREGLQAAFEHYANEDPVDAGNYLVEMKDSPDRDFAISGYAPNLVHTDPAIALQWADSISDPELRAETLIRTGQTYYQIDKEAAKSWLENSELSPEARTRIVGFEADFDPGQDLEFESE